LSAEIERKLISQRTKEALARMKAEGMHIGRPKGAKKYCCKTIRPRKRDSQPDETKNPQNQDSRNAWRASLNVEEVSYVKIVL
jgi:DNA invertase Pin-like site-specific DNA recombinase